MISYILTSESLLCWSYCGLKDSKKTLDFLSPKSLSFFEDLDQDSDASHVALAYHAKRLVGWLRVTIEGETLYAQGTWVEEAYRGQGIAKALWSHALASLDPEVVEVTTSSKGGRGLIESLKKSKPDVRFELTDWSV